MAQAHYLIDPSDNHRRYHHLHDRAMLAQHVDETHVAFLLGSDQHRPQVIERCRKLLEEAVAIVNLTTLVRNERCNELLETYEKKVEKVRTDIGALSYAPSCQELTRKFASERRKLAGVIASLELVSPTSATSENFRKLAKASAEFGVEIDKLNLIMATVLEKREKLVGDRWRIRWAVAGIVLAMVYFALGSADKVVANLAAFNAWRSAPSAQAIPLPVEDKALNPIAPADPDPLEQPPTPPR